MTLIFSDSIRDLVSEVFMTNWQFYTHISYVFHRQHWKLTLLLLSAVEFPLLQAAVDKMKNGGCPICHRYFLVFYILRERGLIDLVVTTFLPESPPKEVLAFSNGKHYPLVKVHSGVDSRGQDITGLECDTVDEIEALLERFDCDDMRSRKESRAEAVAELSFEDLYMVCRFKTVAI